MRIVQLPYDSGGNTLPFPYDSDKGSGTANGFEFEVIALPTDRLQLNLGLGIINTEYVQSGVFDGMTGNYPGAPFAYAPEMSYTLGANYSIPMSNGGQILLIANYGYMDDYARDAAYQRTKIDDNGVPVEEPGYGILNARLRYEPVDRNYSIELWGTNLTDELYTNGGFDTHDTWGYDFSIIGRSREVGVSLGFEF
jgi:iron complex outermembrane receptor protein